MPTQDLLDTPIQLNSDVKSYVPLSVYQENKEAIDRDFILRKTKEGEVMMHATDLLGLIPPASIMNEVSMDDVATPSTVSTDDVAITVRAKWFHLIWQRQNALQMQMFLERPG